MKLQRAWIQLQPQLEPIQVVIIKKLKIGYEVQLKSGMKMTIQPSQLVRMIEAPVVAKRQVSYDQKHVSTKQIATLDLHGSTVVEAKIAIDSFLKRQKAATPVEIVFGKGTGTLKQALIPYVKTHKFVEKVYVDHLRAAFEITTKA
ncbi:MAG: Smr/MutS family protein [Culicoidibacterales bacterium]